MNIVAIAIYIVLGLIGLGLLVMLLFGIRSVAFGKINPLTMAIVCVPLVILVIFGFVMNTWAEAGIMTIIVTLGLALLALLVTGIKGLFT
jgi:hypothetical protein